MPVFHPSSLLEDPRVQLWKTPSGRFKNLSITQVMCKTFLCIQVDVTGQCQTFSMHHIFNILKPIYLLCYFRITYLGVAKLVLRVIHINGPQELLSSFLVVNKLFLRYHAGIQYFVPTRWTLGLVLSLVHIKKTKQSTYLLLTFAWNPHTGFYWGSPSYRSWFLPAHRYIAADGWPDGVP